MNKVYLPLALIFLALYGNVLVGRCGPGGCCPGGGCAIPQDNFRRSPQFNGGLTRHADTQIRRGDVIRFMNPGKTISVDAGHGNKTVPAGAIGYILDDTAEQGIRWAFDDKPKSRGERVDNVELARPIVTRRIDDTATKTGNSPSTPAKTPRRDGNLVRRPETEVSKTAKELVAAVSDPEKLVKLIAAKLKGSLTEKEWGEIATVLQAGAIEDGRLKKLIDSLKKIMLAIKNAKKDLPQDKKDLSQDEIVKIVSDGLGHMNGLATTNSLFERGVLNGKEAAKDGKVTAHNYRVYFWPNGDAVVEKNGKTERRILSSKNKHDKEMLEAINKRYTKEFDTDPTVMSFRYQYGFLTRPKLIQPSINLWMNIDANLNVCPSLKAKLVNVQPGVPVVIKFSANWCVPCKRMSDSFENVTGTFKSKVYVVHVDTDKCSLLTDLTSDGSIPALGYLARVGDNWFMRRNPDRGYKDKSAITIFFENAAANKP